MLRRVVHALGGALRESGVALERAGAAMQGDSVVKDTLSRHRSVMNMFDKRPQLAATAFVAPSASVSGDVVMGPASSVWYSAVVKGDQGQVLIGDNSNIQEGCVVQADPDATVKIGANVSVGHGSVLRNCTVEDSALIGIGSRVLSGAVVQSGSVVGAGSVVESGTVVAKGEVWAGAPAVRLRAVSDQDAGEAAKLVERMSVAAEVHAHECFRSYKDIEAELLEMRLAAERNPDYDSSLGLVGTSRFNPTQAAKDY
jgi:carbonic anhydrase/acetyltransferase-like protein (isoleucine patch superfamily)